MKTSCTHPGWGFGLSGDGSIIVIAVSRVKPSQDDGPQIIRLPPIATITASAAVKLFRINAPRAAAISSSVTAARAISAAPSACLGSRIAAAKGTPTSGTATAATSSQRSFSWPMDLDGSALIGSFGDSSLLSSEPSGGLGPVPSTSLTRMRIDHREWLRRGNPG